MVEQCSEINAVTMTMTRGRARWTVERVQALAAELRGDANAGDAGETRDYSVYAWFRRGECCYVGVSNRPERRQQEHLCDARAGRHVNPLLGNALRKDERSGMPAAFVVLAEGLAREQAYALEAELINTIGRKELGTGPLYNADPGGVGPTLECCRKGAVAGSAAGNAALATKMRTDPEFKAKMIAAARAGARAGAAALKVKMEIDPEFKAKVTSGLRFGSAAGGAASGRANGRATGSANAATLNERRRAAALTSDLAHLHSGEWSLEEFQRVRRRRDQKRACDERRSAELRANPEKAEAERQRQRERYARRRAERAVIAQIQEAAE